MTLSVREIEAVQQGRPVRLAIPEAGAECVLIRADIYDRVHALFDGDHPLSDTDRVWTHEELAQALHLFSRPSRQVEAPIGFDPDDYPVL